MAARKKKKTGGGPAHKKAVKMPVIQHGKASAGGPGSEYYTRKMKQNGPKAPTRPAKRDVTQSVMGSKHTREQMKQVDPPRSRKKTSKKKR